MKAGDIVGHECMAEVVEVGSGVHNLRPGDRVVVPFNIACGQCFFCTRQLWSCCDNINPNAWMAEMAGDKFSIGAIFGKGIAIRCGQTHVHHYLQPLLERIENEDIHPSFIISHCYVLDEAPEAYRNFRHHQNECTKVVLQP